MPRDSADFSLVWKSEADYQPDSLTSFEHEEIAAAKSRSRRIQYCLGRQAAREALRQVGYRGAESLLTGRSGEPLWPEGYCGSISHCDDYSPQGKKAASRVVSAAARCEGIKSIGIDIESKNRPVKSNTKKAVALNKELDWIAAEESSARVLMLLAAKESLFKMINPLTGIFFGMHDAELSWEEGHSAFKAVLLRNISPIFTTGSSWQIDLSFLDNVILATSIYRPKN